MRPLPVTSITTGCTATVKVQVRTVPAPCNITYDYTVPASGATASYQDIVTKAIYD